MISLWLARIGPDCLDSDWLAGFDLVAAIDPTHAAGRDVSIDLDRGCSVACLIEAELVTEEGDAARHRGLVLRPESR